MKIIGINAFHPDAAVALIEDGRVLWAAEEERFSRIKHDCRFPINALRQCILDNQLNPKLIDCIAVSGDKKSNLGKKIKYSLTSGSGFKLMLNRLKPTLNKFSIQHHIFSIINEFDKNLSLDKIKIVSVEHHLCHVSSSYYCTNFDKSSFLSIDGMGDFVSMVSGAIQGGDFKIFNRVYFPNSIGFFYTAATQYLGFSNYGDEYKVMGLASYGRPQFKEQFKLMLKLKSDGCFELNKKYFTPPTGEDFSQWKQGVSTISDLYSHAWIKLFGPARTKESKITQQHMDLAASVQWMLEYVYFHVLNHLYKQTKIDRLCLSGGVAYNCVANGKIYSETPFKEVYIPSASGDAGTAVGAGLYQYYRNHPKSNRYFVKSALLGGQFSSSEIEKVLFKSKGIEFQQMIESDLLKFTSKAVNEGSVIGWFQNRMEFGPRALGARSILADPRRVDIKDLLNVKVKFREKFRPFAPVVKEELADRYFEMKCKSSPFMMNVFLVRPEYRSILAGITHVDNTARVQTVSKAEYPLIWNLLDAFEKLTGVAVMLNTSFNENEPIVSTPKEALDCFLRTQMDYLIIGSYVVSRLKDES